MAQLVKVNGRLRWIVDCDTRWTMSMMATLRVAVTLFLLGTKEWSSHLQPHVLLAQSFNEHLAKEESRKRSPVGRTEYAHRECHSKLALSQSFSGVGFNELRSVRDRALVHVSSFLVGGLFAALCRALPRRRA